MVRGPGSARARILDGVNPEPPPSVPPGRPIDRRELLWTAAAGAGALSFLGLVGCLDPARRERVGKFATAGGAPKKSLSDAEWKALEAAQDRLLPSEPGSPGARDVNAIGYLDAVLVDADTDPDDASLVKDGAARLDKIARGTGARSFADMPPEKRDEALKSLRTVEGSYSWFVAMLKFTLEAFLGDPVYGGNVGEAGWKWAGHEPGSPRPKVPFQADAR